jgi:hypothetical protein
MDMHRLLGRVLLTLPMVAMTMPMPAQASLDLFARITKTKDIRVAERIFIDKHIVINVRLREQYDGAAEADSVSNQLNQFNIVRGNIQGLVPDKPSYGISRHARIADSINRNEGIVGVNQDVGNMVNQGNLVAAALTRTPRSVTNSQAEADQVNRFNNVVQLERLTIQNGQIVGEPDRSATIEDSINFNSGVVGVNQNSGNMNNQLNKLALAVGPGSHVALSEAALGQVNTGNIVSEIETYRVDTIKDSVSNNSGIVGGNQSSGNMNNQASVVSMAVLTSTVKLTTP